MENVEYRKKIEGEMEAALLNGEFKVYLQPKINMITSRVYGAEALSRWMHPTEGIRMPDKYISIFEENGFIFKLDMYMFEEICKMKERWHKEKADYCSIPISINMSRPHLLREDIVDELLAIVRKYDIDPTEIDIEITENMYLKDHRALTQVVERLQESGFFVSIDDFGSGFSALNMLKDIPVNIIKIDKEFLQISADSDRGKKVIKNIIRLCKDLKFNVMVEGVETEEQLGFLVGYGCEIAQGFYYSKPVPVEEFETYTKSHFTASVDIIKFSFKDNYKSDGGKYEAECIGDKFEFVDGVAPGLKAVHFGGGRHNENCLSLPTDILHNDSYTVAMWIKVDRLSAWSSAIFGEYENGFFQFAPLADEGEACFRIRDRRMVVGWFDAETTPLETDKWYHIVMMYDRISGVSRLYINGEQVAKREDVETLYFVKRIFVGSDIYKDSFEGSISELIFYDRALKNDDVVELYNTYASMEGFKL